MRFYSGCCQRRHDDAVKRRVAQAVNILDGEQDVRFVGIEAFSVAERWGMQSAGFLVLRWVSVR